MQANPRTLNQIFNPETRLLAPLFQRPYVWNMEKNWIPLWESVRDTAEHVLSGAPAQPHFLGAIILDQVNSATGTVSAREIIDGQQRLTTLQLFIAAARDLCAHHGQANVQQVFAKLALNDASLSDDPEEKFKVWPTNVDRLHFQRVVTALTPNAIYQAYGAQLFWQKSNIDYQLGQSADPLVQEYLDRRPARTEEERTVAVARLTKPQLKEAQLHFVEMEKANHAIPRAYFFFRAVLDEWLQEEGREGFAKRAVKLAQTIQEQMRIVVIDLDNEDDAQRIFETMNALNTPLLPAELVKNFLFREAERRGEPTQALYDSLWEPFDRPNSWWRQELRQGRLTRHRLDVFLQHYLTLTTGREVQSTDLFSSYRGWANSRNQNLSPSGQLQRLREYADIYQGFDRAPAGTRENLFFERLEALDTTTIYPLLLELFKRHQHKKEDLVTALTDIESFFVRRLVCGLTTKNYNRFVVEMVAHLEKNNDFTPAAIRGLLAASSADSSRWPKDDEFGPAWRERPLYYILSKSRLRMLLEAIDRQMHTCKTENYTLDRNLTIEHLLPQSWQTHWPLPSPLPAGLTTEDAEGNRNALLQTMGNLTLLTQALNPSISNGPWDGLTGKRAQILLHSAINLNRSLPTIWNEEEITKRGEALFQKACLIWPRP